MGKKMIGQKEGQYFFAQSFFCPELLTSETQHVRCAPGFLSIALQRAVAKSGCGRMCSFKKKRLN
jgi:hypothetical protein